MKQDKVVTLCTIYKNDIPPEKRTLLKAKLINASDECYECVAKVKTSSWSLVLVTAIIFGGLGIDRFMVGDIGLGILKLFFGLWTFGIWWFIDIFLSYKKAKENNFKAINEAIF